MQCGVTVHSSRRETLIQATSNGYSKDELMKFAAHTNLDTLRTDYLSSITSVDGLASFLKVPLRSDQSENFRSMTVNRNPELFLSLPAEAQAELREWSDYATITQEIEDLSVEMRGAAAQETISKLKSKRKQLLEQRRVLEKRELDRVRAVQDRIHPAEREGLFHADGHRSKFGRVCHMMEERFRLAHNLFCKAPLRSAVGISVVEDLIALLKNSCRVAYQPLFRPRGGNCPVEGCGLELERLNTARRWKHVFDCSMAHHRVRCKFIQYCFICNRCEWITGKDVWESHCQGHIDKEKFPRRCDFLQFRRATACPGWCLTCMHEERLPASQRLYGYMKRASWVTYVNDCFERYVLASRQTSSISCPSPGCSLAQDSEQDLWYHLQDAYSYPPRNAKTKPEKKRKTFVNGGCDGRVARKRRRVQQQEAGSPVTIASTTQSSVFDIDPTLQEECASVTAVSSLSPSLVNSGEFGDRDTIYPPTSSSVSSFGGPYGISQVGNTSLPSDILRTRLEKWQTGDGSVVLHPPPEALDPATSAETLDPATLAETLVATMNRISPTSHKMQMSRTIVDIELVDPELRNGVASADCMEGVVANSYPGSQGGGNEGNGPPLAIDSEEGVWEVEVLLAKWGQGPKTVYLVEWRGFSDDANTWVRRKDIDPDLVNKFDADYEEDGGNAIGIEVLRERRHRGKLQYLVKWKGRPDAENSWEKESTISSKRIAEFRAQPPL